jgi:hypothetical protein
MSGSSATGYRHPAAVWLGREIRHAISVGLLENPMVLYLIAAGALVFMFLGFLATVAVLIGQGLGEWLGPRHRDQG